MKIKPTPGGKAAFLKLYHQTMKSQTIREKSDPARLYNLRCSQIPYCPRSVLLKWATTGLHFDMDMAMHFYVNVGHAVHNTMQTYLAQSGQFLADYQCKVCKTWHRLSHKFKCCGVPCDYHELSINYKGILGHIDGVVKINGRYYIIDFKTTSLAGSVKKMSKPGVGYIRQITAYAYLIEKQYGIKVAGVMLVFIPRDNPNRPVIWEQEVTEASLEKTRKALKADRSLHKRTMAAKTVPEFKDLATNYCGGEYCDACKMPTPGFLALLKRHRSDFPIKKD